MIFGLCESKKPLSHFFSLCVLLLNFHSSLCYLPVWIHCAMLMQYSALTFSYHLLSHSTVDFPMAPWLIMKASQASNEALNKLTLIIYVKLLAIWTVEILISLGDEIRIRTHTHAHTPSQNCE